MARNSVLKIAIALVLVVGVLIILQPVSQSGLASGLLRLQGRGERFDGEGLGAAQTHGTYEDRMGERFDTEEWPQAAPQVRQRFDEEADPEPAAVPTPRFDDE